MSDLGEPPQKILKSSGQLNRKAQGGDSNDDILNDANWTEDVDMEKSEEMATTDFKNRDKDRNNPEAKNNNNDGTEKRESLRKKNTGNYDSFFVKDFPLKYSRRLDNVYKVNVEWEDDRKMGKMVLAKILERKGITNVFDIKAIGGKKFCVFFNEMESANEFLAGGLSDQKIKVFIPSFYVTKAGIVRGIPENIEMKEVYDDILNKENIIKVERMYRTVKMGEEIKKLPTQSVKITFNDTSLPECIQFPFYKERIFPFIGRVRQCFNCWRFGHTAANCKATFRCGKCGDHHKSTECTQKEFRCISCQGNHPAGSKDCPEKARQENIKILMDARNLNFSEVIELYPQYTTKNSFSLLENLEEFPQLTRRNYASVLKAPQNRIRVLRPKAQRKERIQIDRNRMNRYYGDLLQTETVSPITGNANKTTELERLMAIISHLQSKVENEMMGFQDLGVEKKSELITEFQKEINNELKELVSSITVEQSL